MLKTIEIRPKAGTWSATLVDPVVATFG